MPGTSPSFDLSYVPTSIAGQALPIAVCLYTPGANPPYTLLPNVRCLRIDYREGPEPPAARFAYAMGDALAATLGWPSQFEQLWPIDAQGNYIVQVDDRLVVLTADPWGDPIVMFDGFAQIPQVDVSAQAQGVTFVAVGVAARLWDEPITGRVQRNGDAATTTDRSADVATDLPCRFNPSDTSVGALGGYVGNAVGEEFHSELDGGDVYPVFADPLLAEQNPDLTGWWSTGGALKYLMATVRNPVDGNGDEYVQFPTFSGIDLVVDCYEILGAGVQNAGDVDTSYVHVRDYDAANKAVPQVFSDLLGYSGLVLNYSTATAEDGTPLTELQVLRRDAFAAAAAKLVYLAEEGATTLDLAGNNAAAIHLARDTNSIANSWDIETGPKQIEISVYLAPAIQPTSGDQNMPTLATFFSSNLTAASSTQRRKYRWFIADECGDGHWNVQDDALSTQSLDLSPVFPPTHGGSPSYVKRYRPGSRTLIAKDPEGRPLKAVLQILQPEPSAEPAISSSVGTGWQTITHGWQLLDDRLGIEISIENPEDWQTGNPKIPKISAVTWLANPTDATNFQLRLTTVIDSDQTVEISAPKRVASPTEFTRTRSADGRDHFQYCSIATGSLNYAAQGGNGTDPLVVRDDTKAATTHAVQLRSAHEFPVLAGSVTIPFLTDYYQIGDRVKIVQGRNASLQINVGADQGETPTYPWVTAFSWVLEHDRQETTLQLSDRRAEPQR